MKKTDIVQPVAMASAFAEGVYSSTSTSDFEIPAATSSSPTDTCVLDDGFLPITSTALDDGGIAPERKNFNGMFYLSTDQRFYVQNGGFITYDANVATAIGGYPEGAVLDFIDSNGKYRKVISLIDDNTNNFVSNEALIDGTHWAEVFANIDLQNIDSTITSIPPTSLINFDSKYTYQAATNLLTSITLPTKATTTYYGDVDLTSYLPADNYDYDVWLSLYIASNAGVGNYVTVTVTGETGTPFNIQTRCEVNLNQFTQGTGHTIVGSGRKISVYYIATGGGTLTNLHMYSYRRLGTNA